MDILIFPFLISFYFLISGDLIRKKIFTNFKTDESIEYILSLFFLSNLFLFLNFFTSLNKFINSLVFLIPLIYIFFLNKKLIFKKLKISLIFSVFFALFISFDNVNRPDAGLYHLPFISILNENKIIFGSANLHFRFGHTSILQYLEAGFNNVIFKDHGILLPKALFYFAISKYFLKEFYLNINTKRNYFTILSFLILFQILYDMNRYSYHGNDIPAHLIIYFVSYFFLRNSLSNFNNFFFISLLCLFSFQIKTTSLLMLILPLTIVIFNKNKFGFFFKSRNIIILIFFSLWLIKNLFISGCLIFPIKQTCLSNIYWNSSLLPSNNDVYKVSEENEAWAKGWPDRKDSSLNYEGYLKSNWVVTWSKNHGKNVFLKKIIPLIILILFIYFVNKNLYKNLNIIPYYFKKNLVLFFILFFGFILWFLKFPTYRYGSSYIVGSIIFAQFYFFKNFLIGKKLKNFLKIFIIFTILIVCLKYLTRYDREKSIWPNIYSFTTKVQEPEKFKKVYKEDKFLYFNPGNKLCMYSSSPCTNIPTHSNINLKEIYGYKIYYLDFK